MVDGRQTRFGLLARANRSAGLANQLFTAICLLLGVLGELHHRKRRDLVPAWRKALAWRARPGRASGIFICYRRDDAGPYARLLQVYLHGRFPHATVFMDLDSIEAGTDFAEAIEAGVGSCRVLIALIGPSWLALTDEEGQRKLDHPDDWVRFEIRTALENRIRVIPVLVDGAKMPRQQQLPSDVRNLARLNALEMTYDRYEYDTSRLAVIIRKALAPASNAERLHSPR
jgi:TIR domain